MIDEFGQPIGDVPTEYGSFCSDACEECEEGDTELTGQQLAEAIQTMIDGK